MAVLSCNTAIYVFTIEIIHLCRSRIVEFLQKRKVGKAFSFCSTPKLVWQSTLLVWSVVTGVYRVIKCFIVYITFLLKRYQNRQIILGHCMCKELPVIPVNKVVDPKRIIGKKWRAEEEERHKGLLTPPPQKKNHFKLSQPVGTSLEGRRGCKLCI
jgi:hypothetical protein